MTMRGRRPILIPGRPEDRVLCRDHDIAAGRKPAAAGPRIAVHLGDEGCAHPRHALEDAREFAEGLARLQRRAAIAHALEIGARAEGLVPRPRPREHDDPCLGVRLEGGQGVLELADQRRAQRVADFGTVEGDRGDALPHLDEKGLVGHAASSSTMSRNCFRMRAVAPQMMSSTETS